MKTRLTRRLCTARCERSVDALPVVAECHHDVIQFIKRDEATSVFDFLLIDRVCELSDFGSRGTIAVPELSSLYAIRAVAAMSSVNEIRTFDCCLLLIHETCLVAAPYLNHMARRMGHPCLI